jgi:hypothetical protein
LEVQFHIFPALDRCEWPASRPPSQRINPGTHWKEARWAPGPVWTYCRRGQSLSSRWDSKFGQIIPQPSDLTDYTRSRTVVHHGNKKNEFCNKWCRNGGSKSQGCWQKHVFCWLRQSPSDGLVTAYVCSDWLYGKCDGINSTNLQRLSSQCNSYLCLQRGGSACKQWLWSCALYHTAVLLDWNKRKTGKYSTCNE